MTNSHPRLRSHVRRRKSGKVVTYYTYDRRPDGEPDIALGTDYAEALKRWDEIHNRAPRIAGTLQEAFDRFKSETLPAYTSAETRKGYTSNLRKLEPVFGPASWSSIELPTLVEYLARRTGKTQANREIALLSIIWNKARLWGMTRLPWPAAGMERSRWKNPEKARRFEVTDALFDAVYAEANQVLRDCMDLATATGMRLTDCRTIPLPHGDLLRLKASKTGKAADFELNLSAVLPDLIRRRRESKAMHTALLSSVNGKRLTPRMLRDYYDEARNKAVQRAQAAHQGDLVEQLKAMYLRDMRKRAADLVDTDQDAANLLQHGDVRLTQVHYRTKVQRIKPAR